MGTIFNCAYGPRGRGLYGPGLFPSSHSLFLQEHPHQRHASSRNNCLSRPRTRLRCTQGYLGPHIHIRRYAPGRTDSFIRSCSFIDDVYTQCVFAISQALKAIAEDGMICLIGMGYSILFFVVGRSGFSVVNIGVGLDGYLFHIERV